MKIAVVHDYLKEYGGAEKVVEEVFSVFPEAELYTTLFAPEYLGPHQKRFQNLKVHTSFFQYIPFKEKLISPLRLLSPFAFKQFNLSTFDVIIISQTGAYFPNLVSKTKDQALITYTHTPPRYLYGYKTAREWKNNIVLRVLGETANHFLRIIDYKAAQNVDHFVANSEEIKARIQKFYRREATVINPPVDIPSIELIKNKENFYVTGGRLARAKGIDSIIDAFNENGKKLKIFGKGFAGFEEELKSRAGKNIEFMGEVTQVEKWKLLRKAKAFIFASYDEDFGITPVEAMACGTPVVAYRSGGVKETVKENETGIFFDENTPEALNEALEKFEGTKFDPEKLHTHARKFSTDRFHRELKDFVETHAGTSRS